MQFATAQRSPFPPQRTVPKVEELAPTRPMKPETKKASGIPTRHASSKTTGTRGNQASSSEASTSQEGHGRKVNGEWVRLPGKPIRVLHLPKKPIGVLHLNREASKDSVSQAGKGYVDNFEPVPDDVYLPGKPIRILRLY